ncbi:MAG: hypothetical protein VX593_09560 [Pseudomonadota bacterium]|nr:hypothetical protein [Pseudomonadota bacterium]
MSRAMQANQSRELKRLVALKRQQAEQAFALAQAALRREEKKLDALKQELASIDATSADYADFALSMRFGLTERLMQKIDLARQSVARRKASVDAAKHALKKAMYSEDRVREV